MTTPSIVSEPKLLAVPSKRLDPHCVFFFLFNLIYFLPVLGVLLFNYSEGGADSAADLDAVLAKRLAWIYLLGVLAFLCGSALGKYLTNRDIYQPRALQLFRLNFPFKAVCLGTIAVLALSKFLLIPLGVYSDYAFDTESMTNSVWSFSMFCSESLLFLSIIVLFSNARRNIRWFLLLTAVNSLNLLHGTRMFFVIAGIAFCFYLYLRAKLTFKIAILLVGCSLGVGYLVFLSRSHIDTDEQTFSLARLISPIMFESIFSQLSLIETVRHPDLWSAWGSIHNFFLDVIYLVIPRFLYPDKDKMLFINRFSDLSPLGAFSGYAQGLIYFGVFFPFFYLTLGAVAGWLLHHARSSQFWSAIYVYFACDFMFRIMRDGYIIPVKMLVNALTILAFVVSCSYIRLPQGVTSASTRNLRASTPSNGS